MEPSGVRNAASPVPEVPSGRPLHTQPGLARCATLPQTLLGPSPILPLTLPLALP